jgi:outer membrane protein OmpA-like peptidoglycan-associated protein
MNRYAMTMLVAAVGVSGCAHQQKTDADTLTVRPAPPPPSKEPQLALTQPEGSHVGAKKDGQAALEQALAATRVYFDFDEATLNVDGQNSLQQVAKVLRSGSGSHAEQGTCAGVTI